MSGKVGDNTGRSSGLLKAVSSNEVESLSSDPGSPSNGQIWYNTTSNTFKVYGTVTADTWANGGNVGTTYYAGAGAGIQTSAMSTSGVAGSPNSNRSESYNGTSWSSETASPATQYNSGVGASETTFLMWAGDGTANYDYNGSAWSTNNAAHRNMGVAGQVGTASACINYFNPSPYNTCNTYNGTSWSSLNNTVTASNSGRGAGTAVDDAIGMGGSTDSDHSQTWNGTCWSSANNMGSLHIYGGGFGTGASAAYMTGGINNTSKVTAKFDGTSWAAGTSDTQARNHGNDACGSMTAGLAFGGNTISPSSELTGGSAAVTTITTS